MATIIAICVIVISLLVYALWDSLDRLKHTNKVLGCLIIVTGVAVWVVSERVETLQNVADAKEALAHQQKVRSLEQRVKSRAELLSAEARGQLVADLRKLPDGEFHLSTNSNSPEAREFGDTVFALMTEAQCDFTRTHAHILVDAGRPINGVLVVHSGDTAPPLAKALYDAFAAAGIGSVSLENWGDKVFPGVATEVYIGPRMDAPLDDLRATDEKLANKLGGRADLLKPAVRARLIEQLKNLPPKSVTLMVSEATSETKEFGGLLESTFGASGCLDKQLVAGGPGLRSVGEEGIVVDNQPGVANSANILASALTAAGILDVRLVELPPALRSPAGKITVWVFREKIRD